MEQNVGNETTILHGTLQIAMYTCSTSSLSTSVVEKILRSPETEKVITVPPVKPKGGEVYVYSYVDREIAQGID